jgi:hypothetical protein
MTEDPMQIEPQSKTSEQVTQEYEGFQRTSAETAKRLPKQKSRKSLWKVCVVVILCIYLYEKKSGIVWLPVADSQQMCVLMSDWWGLRVQAYYPVWRKPTGETDEYSEQWCIKYPDNSWRSFYGGHGEARTPPVTYSTYF